MVLNLWRTLKYGSSDDDERGGLLITTNRDQDDDDDNVDDNWIFRDPSWLPIGRSNRSSYIHTHKHTQTQLYTSEISTNVFVFSIW